MMLFQWFAMVPIARWIGAGPLHALMLAAGGVSMLLPGVTDKAMLFAFAMASVNLGFRQIGLGLYDGLLGGDPRNVLRVLGVCMFIAVLSFLWVREGWKKFDEGVPVAT